MAQSFIHILPPQVANQIAAGEVVERPASAVKELMENSVDAGAKHITVRITGAGKKKIEIEDDGMGMSAADAELALERHATSKIETSEDLHHIASHGFRGEALPSIASVCRFRMTTCFKDSNEAVEVRVDGGLNTELRPAPKRKGTKIEIADLFLNTPARLQFMRTDKTDDLILSVKAKSSVCWRLWVKILPIILSAKILSMKVFKSVVSWGCQHIIIEIAHA
jgi:DNA mismatch repair protein MutL